MLVPLRVIIGSSVNNDGYSLGMMAPNPDGQVITIQEAMKDARIETSELSYIETHGTGSKIGDYIEIKALRRIFEE